MDKPIETKDKSPRITADVIDAPRGFLPAVTTLAIDTVEIGATTTLGLGQDLRTELAKSAVAVIDTSEAVLKSAFAIARRLTQRIDGATAEVLGTLERIVGTSAGAARLTTRDAASVAAGAVNAVIAPRGN